MSSFGAKLRTLRAEKGLSQEELGKSIGSTKQVISRYEKSLRSPKISAVALLAEALGVSLSYFDENQRWVPAEDNNARSISSKVLTPAGHRIGRAYEAAPEPEQVIVERVLEPYIEVEVGEEPDEPDVPDNIIRGTDFLGVSHAPRRASAGTGVYLHDDGMMETIYVREDALPRNYSNNPDRYFSLTVSGDSMEPRYHDGDILLVSKEPVNVGEIGIFVMENEGYVKKLGVGMLCSLNPMYDDIRLSEDVRCCGKVVDMLDPDDISAE